MTIELSRRRPAWRRWADWPFEQAGNMESILGWIAVGLFLGFLAVNVAEACTR